MTKYKYLAKGSDQKLVEGTLEADSEDQVVIELQNQGLFPVQISKTEESPISVALTKRPKIKRKELTFFTLQLYDLISAGVTLMRSLEVIESQTHSKSFKEVLHSIISDIRRGQKFSDALKTFPSLFSPFMINLIRSGEASGKLDEVLMRIADFSEAQEEMRSKVKSALAYPAFVSAVGFCVILILIIFIVPRISGIFEDLGQELPLLTQILIWVSHGIQYYWWLFAIAIGFLVVFLKVQLASREGVRLWDRWLLRTPFFGEIHRQNEIARFARTLHMLLNNGVPFVQALEIVQDTLSSPIFKDDLQELRSGVSKGLRIREILKKSHFFPVHVTHMLMIGEESGQLERSLKRIYESFERSVDRNIKLATSLLEPVLILIVGSLVGLIALAMLLPIFQINFLIR